jgi:hypothetical protein
VKIDTTEKYRERYRRRGERQRRRWAKSFMKSFIDGTPRRIGDGSKPNHLERAVSITDCWPALKLGHDHE